LSLVAIGIMQGRLASPENGAIQAFPRASWRDEFSRAAEAGLDTIEWIHDGYGADVNPILTPAGQAEMRKLMAAHGVAVRSLCADWFMDYPLVGCGKVEQLAREQHLHRLLDCASKVGIEQMVIPFVDASSMKTAEYRAQAGSALLAAAPQARRSGIELHVECDLPPDEFADFLVGLPSDVVKVNFDSGNSAALGYASADEFAAWGPRLGSVHIKDRARDGGTVPLGKGNCDFDAVFAGLAALKYRGDFILQVARGEVGEEVALARTNRNFVKLHLAEAN
jgi:L-ribulose-5-phosphate 3-epimerase